MPEDGGQHDVRTHAVAYLSPAHSSDQQPDSYCLQFAARHDPDKIWVQALKSKHRTASRAGRRPSEAALPRSCQRGETCESEPHAPRGPLELYMSMRHTVSDSLGSAARGATTAISMAPEAAARHGAGHRSALTPASADQVHAQVDQDQATIHSCSDLDERHERSD